MILHEDLRDELVRLANIYQNKASADVNNAKADKEAKDLSQKIVDETYDVLVAFANEVAKPW